MNPFDEAPTFPPQDSLSIIFIALASVVIFGIIFLKWYRDEYLPAQKRFEEKQRGQSQMNKLFLIIIIFIMLATLRGVSSASFAYNVTSVPYSTIQEVTITVPTEDLPSIINVTYDGWLSGVVQVVLTDTNFAKINVSVDVPENISDGNYEKLATFASDKGKRLQVGFQFAITAGKVAQATNITTSCQTVVIGNASRIICDISSVGAEQKPEVITEYNITPVTSCADLYADDYQSIVNENGNLKNDLEKIDRDYKNFTKIVLTGCQDEESALVSCNMRKTEQENKQGIRLPDDYCAPYQQKFDVCNNNKKYIEKQAIVGLDLVPKLKFNMVLVLFGLLIAVDILAAALPWLAKEKRRF